MQIFKYIMLILCLSILFSGCDSKENGVETIAGMPEDFAPYIAPKTEEIIEYTLDTVKFKAPSDWEYIDGEEGITLSIKTHYEDSEDFSDALIVITKPQEKIIENSESIDSTETIESKELLNNIELLYNQIESIDVNEEDGLCVPAISAAYTVSLDEVPCDAHSIMYLDDTEYFMIHSVFNPNVPEFYSNLDAYMSLLSSVEFIN